MAMPSTRYPFVSPISLAATPAVGDTIVATINGVEYAGEWEKGNDEYDEYYANLYHDIPKKASGGPNEGYALVTIGGAAFFEVAKYENEPPTTDYTVTLALYRKARRVTIPQDYVEGLSDLATDVVTAQSTANSAKTTAETAQSTANSAKTTAVTAQSTANSAKTTAETAQSTANSAKTAAETAQSTANSAKTAAETAQSTANTAVRVENGYTYRFESTSSENPCPKVYLDDFTHHSRVTVSIENDTALLVHLARDGGAADTSTVFNPATIRLIGSGVANNNIVVDGVKAFILPSSTAGSTKKFKLTVDDSGALTATEVTT